MTRRAESREASSVRGYVRRVLLEREVSRAWYKKLKRAVQKHFDPDSTYVNHKLLDYLQEMPALGEGSSRIAYKLEVTGYEPTVFKVTKNPFGRSQTKTEVHCYEKGTSKFIPEVYDWHPEFAWIEMEYLHPVTWDDVLEEAGLQGTWDLRDLFEEVIEGEDEETILNMIDANPEFVQNLLSLRDVCDLQIGDLTVEEHWGKDSYGNLKVADFGFKGWGRHSREERGDDPYEMETRAEDMVESKGFYDLSVTVETDGGELYWGWEWEDSFDWEPPHGEGINVGRAEESGVREDIYQAISGLFPRGESPRVRVDINEYSITVHVRIYGSDSGNLTDLELALDDLEEVDNEISNVWNAIDGTAYEYAEGFVEAEEDDEI